MSLEGAKVVVVGLERSGMAAIELLRARGAVVTATDARPLDQLPLAAPLAHWRVRFLPQCEDAFTGQDLAVISPGVPAGLDLLENARRRGMPVIGEVELAARYLEGPILGVTGSNGKTTTTALTGHLLRAGGIPVQVGGNIGTPASSLVATSRPGQWNVLELSSFQLETIDRLRARIAVALNVTPDHLDRHSTMEAYTAAKARLFENQREADFAVLNADDAACVGFAAATRARPLWFSLTRPVTPGLWLEEGQIHFDAGRWMAASEIPLRGRHNIENVMAAAAAARLAGGGLEALAGGVRSFPGVEHRLEFVRRLDGVDYYNDSKATNVDAALKAIDAFSEPLWIILGGKDKGSDYSVLRRPLAARARAALLIGAAAAKIAEQLGGAVPVTSCGTLEAALRAAAAGAVRGEIVLLAPACASFDQFENFEHRGRTFKDLVNALAEKSQSASGSPAAAKE